MKSTTGTRAATRRTKKETVELVTLERRALLTVFYVDDTAPGSVRDGASWATAYTDLQAALDATATTAGPDEVRVAVGTYRPTVRTEAADPRSACFSLFNNVSLLGGYPDGGGASRDPAANVSRLSGDLNTAGSAADNSYHVVRAVGVDRTALLDGFTITGGNADGSLNSPHSLGGGIFNISGSSPTLANCMISGNAATRGGGMYNGDRSAPTLTNCVVIDNLVGFEGGGMFNAVSSPTLTNCTFSANSAQFGGGMANIAGSSPALINCTFSRNGNVSLGGGIYNVDSSPALTNCKVSENSATLGGGMSNSASSPTLINCTFSGNLAALEGGGISNSASSPTLINCTLSGNTADTPGPRSAFGGAMHNSGGSFPRLANCIVWGNEADEGASIEDIESRTTVHHSLVQGGWPGVGNLDADPLFAADLRLQAGSPAVDAGDTAAIPAGVATDLAGQPRVKGRAVDMGAYELPQAQPQPLAVEGTAGNDKITVTLSGSLLVATVNGTIVSTRPVSEVNAIELDGLGGNDTLDVANSITIRATLDGGAGNDTLKGGGGNDMLQGGAGDDVLDGRRGADVFSGGAGRDAADYSSRSKSVSVGIGKVADDGEAGEGDNVRTDVEDVYGGRGNDYLNGSSADNRLYGGPGNDYIIGGGGKDLLSGGSGNDRLFSRDGIKDRSIDGGVGFDTADADAVDALLNIERSTIH